jgi:integrase
MVKQLNVKKLEAIKAKAGADYRVEPDGLVGGLMVRYGARGRANFTLAYRLRGEQRQRRVKLGQWWNGEGKPPAGFLTLQNARAMAVEAKEKAAMGIDPFPPDALPAPCAVSPIETFGQAAERFVKEHIATLKRSAVAEQTFRRIFVEALKDRALASISRADIRYILGQIKARGAGYMANRAFSSVHMFFTWCAENDLLPANPLLGMMRPLRDEEKRDRVLTDDELVMVWKAVAELHPPRRDAVRALILTGTRRSEVAGMRWSELDLERREWTIPKERTKNGEAHLVYLSEAMLAIICARQEERIGGCDFVFTYDGQRGVSQLSTYFPRLVTKLGFVTEKTEAATGKTVKEASIRLHDLRRTFASGCQRLGVAPHIIERCLGHKVAGVQGVYQRHEYSEERRAATERWGQHVERIIAGKADSNVAEFKRQSIVMASCSSA